MQFPESWLREFCDPALSTDALAELLTMSGMEVESLRPVAPAFSGVVAAKVLSVEPHPNAERLRVCKVDVGVGTPLAIVCGAPNVRAGITVPCAMVGAQLPPPSPGGEAIKIARSSLRGVDSEGMLCSARELGLSQDHGGLLLLDDSAPAGEDLRAWLDLDDTLFELKLTPNLGHCLSVFGIAREVSALTGTPLKLPAIPSAAVGSGDRLDVQVAASDLCGRFSGRVIRHVNPHAATPSWMVERLARCGQRSVSALVDISNYVMFEFGQPSHIFDRDRIDGGLSVRWAREGEQLELLSGATVELDATVGVIADARAVESLAGIMGGAQTAVSDETHNVYVEAAFWIPESVAGRSRRFNFTTEAGHRFERGVDPAGTVRCIERITALITEICGTPETVCGPIDDHDRGLARREPVAMRVARASKVIGFTVTQQQCADVFTRLGLTHEQEAGRLIVTPPSWRFDLKIEEDLIEEVIRVIGYSQLPETPPLAPITPRASPESRRSVHELRRAVAARDYVEVINFSFVESRWEEELAGNVQAIRVLNPIAGPLAVMRSSLLGGLIQALHRNLARKSTRIRLFEIGRVFLRDDAAPSSDFSVAGLHQPTRLAGLAYGSADQLQWSTSERPVDFFDVKGDIETWLAPLASRFEAGEHPAMHPGRCARVLIGGKAIGHVGELHPRWHQTYDLRGAAPVLFEIDLDAMLERPVPRFAALARQQPVWRDLALVVPEGVTHDSLLAALHSAASRSLRGALVFDVYKPSAENRAAAGLRDGERSVAVRIEWQDDDVTMTEASVEQEVGRLVDALGRDLRVRLRA